MRLEYYMRLKDGREYKFPVDKRSEFYDSLERKRLANITVARLYRVDEKGEQVGVPLFRIDQPASGDNPVLVQACAYCGSEDVTARRDQEFGMMLHCKCGVVTSFSHKPDQIDEKMLTAYNRRVWS